MARSPQFQKVCDMQKTSYENGAQAGQVLLLERLLKIKFGELSVRATRKLRTMTDGQLGQLAERMMTAEKLSELNLK